MFDKLVEAVKSQKISESLAKMAIGLGVGLVMLVIFIVIAFGVFYGANTSGWNSTVIQIWGYIPQIVVAVVIAVLAGFALHEHYG